MVDAAAAHDVIVLGRLFFWCRRRVECVGKASSVDRILLVTIDNLRRLGTEHFVEGRDKVVDMMKLRSRRLVGLDAFGPVISAARVGEHIAVV